MKDVGSYHEQGRGGSRKKTKAPPTCYLSSLEERNARARAEKLQPLPRRSLFPLVLMLMFPLVLMSPSYPLIPTHRRRILHLTTTARKGGRLLRRGGGRAPLLCNVPGGDGGGGGPDAVRQGGELRGARTHVQ